MASSRLGVLQGNLRGGGFFGVALAGEKENPPLFPVIDALKLFPAADGPIDGVGADAQFPLHLLAQLQRVPGLPVHLVDEGEDGDLPQGADLEELPRLGFHALGSVDDHHGGVRRHESAVSVLGEVLVAGGVQNIDAKAPVLKLHDGTGDRDAPLFFNLHPVAGGGPGALALDLSGLGDCPAVEKEFLRQRGFAGVRVGDDGEGAPPGDFRAVVRHSTSMRRRALIK